MNKVSYDQMVRNLFKKMPTQIESLLHATVGMAGEVCELVTAFDNKDSANIEEELGDYMFYFKAAVIELDYGITIPQRFELHYGTTFEQLIAETGNLLDTIKKCWAYEKKFDPDSFLSQLEYTKATYDQLVSELGYTLTGIADQNQEKLGKRYPKGVYSNKDAIFRVDKNGSN